VGNKRGASSRGPLENALDAAGIYGREAFTADSHVQRGQLFEHHSRSFGACSTATQTPEQVDLAVLPGTGTAFTRAVVEEGRWG